MLFFVLCNDSTGFSGMCRFLYPFPRPYSPWGRFIFHELVLLI